MTQYGIGEWRTRDGQKRLNAIKTSLDPYGPIPYRSEDMREDLIWLVKMVDKERGNA